MLEEFKAIKEKVINEYATIFKAGVLLLAVSLSGLVQTLPELSHLGQDSRKTQFEIEEKYNIDNIMNLDCTKLTPGSAECKLAQYKYRENEHAMNFTMGVVVTLFYIGVVLIFVSGMSFAEKAKRDWRGK